jgi:hypothetical protein
MKKTVQVKIPTTMYSYLKHKAKSNQTSMRIEANLMFNEYFKLKKLETKLESKRGKFLFIK